MPSYGRFVITRAAIVTGSHHLIEGREVCSGHSCTGHPAVTRAAGVRATSGRSYADRPAFGTQTVGDVGRATPAVVSTWLRRTGCALPSTMTDMADKPWTEYPSVSIACTIAADPSDAHDYDPAAPIGYRDVPAAPIAEFVASVAEGIGDRGIQAMRVIADDDQWGRSTSHVWCVRPKSPRARLAADYCPEIHTAPRRRC